LISCRKKVSDVVDLRPSAVIGAKPYGGTDSLQSAKTSSTARNKIWYYSWETCDVKTFNGELLGNYTYETSRGWEAILVEELCFEHRWD